MVSQATVLTPLDVAAQIDPIIVSADPEVQRDSTSAWQVRDGSGASGTFRWVVDAMNKRVGLSTFDPVFVPLNDFHFEAQGGTPTWLIDFYGGNSSNFQFTGQKAEGTKAAPTALTDDSDMWEFAAQGFDGVAFSGMQAVILFEAAGAWTALSHGTRQVFKTTEQASTAQVEVLVLGDDGCVVVTGQTGGFTGAVAGEFLRVEGGTRLNGDVDLVSDFTMAPLVDDNWSFGTAALRLTLVRAVTITSGDLCFENGWRMTEDYEDDGIVFQDAMRREIFAIRKSGLYLGGKKLKSVEFEDGPALALAA